MTNRSRRNYLPTRFLLPSALSVFSFCFAVPAKERHTRIDLFPRVLAGQAFEYEVSYHSEKWVKTETPAFASSPANSGKMDVNALIRFEVLGVHAQGERAAIHGRTTFRVLNSQVRQKIPGFEPPDQVQREESAGKFVEFTILPEGRVDEVKGLDQLPPDQLEGWQEWISRFLLAATLPPGGIHLQQRWNSAEPEKSPSPIGGLQWLRESTYAGDQVCRPVEITVTGQIAASDAEAQTCAVILTTAALRQRSKEKDATPEEFRVRELRTTGKASGKNRIVTYVSLKTGLLVRATEEATQQMDVIVAKSDGSNRVHYEVEAKSRSEVLLLRQTALVQ
jgi:hypothetical protein